ncbi:uncharacterized protein LOC127794374 [Diospyros lotus]|uniref:uncharacterized protein LOC127794374 n=1 Tax=Diospyros lotus TaxID=55363 RepID=UPI00225551A8|nr:uncharacterized protein LOC127794374 [Diospyros lotus]
MVKQCEDEIELGECDDKKCSDVCNKQFSNTTSSSCLPNGGTCQCYHICEKGHVVDCWQDIHIVGCTNSECYGACLQNVRGAVSGTCLRAGTGDQNCQCQIPCGGS